VVRGQIEAQQRGCSRVSLAADCNSFLAHTHTLCYTQTKPVAMRRRGTAAGDDSMVRKPLGERDANVRQPPPVRLSSPFPPSKTSILLLSVQLTRLAHPPLFPHDYHQCVTARRAARYPSRRSSLPWWIGSVKNQQSRPPAAVA